MRSPPGAPLLQARQDTESLASLLTLLVLPTAFARFGRFGRNPAPGDQEPAHSAY